jgi:hypothetical protein
MPNNQQVTYLCTDAQGNTTNVTETWRGAGRISLDIVAELNGCCTEDPIHECFNRSCAFYFKILNLSTNADYSSCPGSTNLPNPTGVQVSDGIGVKTFQSDGSTTTIKTPDVACSDGNEITIKLGHDQTALTGSISFYVCCKNCTDAS